MRGNPGSHMIHKAIYYKLFMLLCMDCEDIMLITLAATSMIYNTTHYKMFMSLCS